jgi:cytochrome c2
MKQQILAAAFISATAFAATPALAGDVAKGESVFKKCASCHMVGEGAKNKVGPILTNVVGSQIASVEGYKYGKSIVALGETGATWTEEEIFEYLADPKKYLRAKLEDKKAKSKMSFKLKKEEERKDVIAYLASLSSNAAASEEDEAASEEETSTTTN